MTPRKKTLNEQLVELGQAVADAKVRAREVRSRFDDARAEVERIGEARVEAFAAGDEGLAAKLQAERGKAEATVLDLQERLAGAERGVQRAEVERAQFATHYCDAILAERLPDAQAAVGAVKDAVGRFVTAKDGWQQIGADTRSLLRLAGRSTAHVPTFPERLAELARDAKRAGDVDVPLPVPGVPRTAAAVVVPEDIPDPAIPRLAISPPA